MNNHNNDILNAKWPHLHRGVSAASDISSTLSWLHTDDAPPFERVTSADLLYVDGGLHPLASDDMHSTFPMMLPNYSLGAFPSNMESVFSSHPPYVDEEVREEPERPRRARTRGGWSNGIFVPQSPKAETKPVPPSTSGPQSTHTLRLNRGVREAKREAEEEILTDPESGDTDMSSPESRSSKSQATLISEGYHSFQKTVTAKNCSKSLSFRERQLFVTNQSKNGSLYMIIQKPAGQLHGRIELLTNTLALEEFNSGDDDERVTLNRFCRGRDKDYIVKDTDAVAMYKITKTPEHEKIVPPTKNIIGSFQDMKRCLNGWQKVLNCRCGGLRVLGRMFEGEQYDVLGSTRIVLPEAAGSYLLVFYPLQGLLSKASQTKIMKRPLQRIGLYLEKSDQVLAGSSFIMCTKDPRPRKNV